ncbi:hypothetical protein THTE_0145 [Thermogutta terrifontis]|uniref:Uncharacterized protein n=1 Tax=Thermogutta terrifontis TaxID=1331910 RepID=A0A286R9Z5_9BACT|nr:hypothetical protein THTE_0145 [Thermogutta terrifontis]
MSSFRIGSTLSPLSITKPATFCGIDLLVLLELPKWGQTGTGSLGGQRKQPSQAQGTDTCWESVTPVF